MGPTQQRFGRCIPRAKIVTFGLDMRATCPGYQSLKIGRKLKEIFYFFHFINFDSGTQGKGYNAKR